MEFLFKPDSEETARLMEWWSSLQDNPAARAQIRRCQDTTSVVFVPSFHRLLYSIKAQLENSWEWQNKLATIAAVSSHIRTQTTQDFAIQLAKEGLKDLRFQRLMQREQKELMLPLIRVIAFLKGQANIQDLAQSIFYWNDNTRKQWSYKYYGESKTEEGK